MICIRLPDRDKWHYLRDGRALCGTPGEEIERREIALADAETAVCLNCDRKLRSLGRAKRPPRKPRPKIARETTYRPKNRERFT